MWDPPSRWGRRWACSRCGSRSQHGGVWAQGGFGVRGAQPLSGAAAESPVWYSLVHSEWGSSCYLFALLKKKKRRPAQLGQQSNVTPHHWRLKYWCCVYREWAVNKADMGPQVPAAVQMLEKGSSSEMQANTQTSPLRPPPPLSKVEQWKAHGLRSLFDVLF